MDTDPAAANHVNELERASPNELAIRLSLLFEKIPGPDQEPRLVCSYVVGIHRRSISVPHSECARSPRSLSGARETRGVEEDESPGHGFIRFGQAALDAGLVPTMKSIITATNQGDHSVLAVYYGIDAFARLCKTGTLGQKRTLAKEVLERDVLPIIYDVRPTIRFVWSAGMKLVP